MRSGLERNDLDDRLRNLGRQLDDQRAAWRAASPTPRRSERSWRRPALTAAVSVMVVAAALVAVADRNADAPANRGGPATSIALAGDSLPVATPTTATPSTTQASGVLPSSDDGPVGVFPVGDAAAVAAAGFESPEAVVAAYLQSRIDPTLVPGGVDVTATVYGSRLVTDDRALVSFGLQMPEDGSDGHAEVVRVTAGDGTGGGWVVVQAFVASLEIPAMSLDNGRLRGAVSGGYPTAVLTVSDGATGEELGSQDVGVPADPAWSGRPPGLPVAVDDLPVADASVRVWNTDAEGSAVPVFGEFVIRAGHPVVVGSRVIGLDAYPDYPFFTDAAVSAIDDLGNGETLTVVGGDDSIVVSHDIGGHTYCVTATSGGLHQQSCWPASMIAAGDAREYVGSLLYRIVPDGVAVTQDGEEIPVVGNVWFTHTDDMGHSPLVEFTDGEVTQTEGGEPGAPPVDSSPTPSTSSPIPPPPTIVVRPAGAATPPTLAASELAASPNAPDLYPVADGVDPATVTLSADATGPSFSEFAVGKVVDGEVSDAVTIYVGPADAIGSSDPNGAPVTVYGHAGTIVTETIAAGEGNSIVTWGDDPTFVAVGTDPMAFLDTSEDSPFSLVDGDDGNPTVEVGTLPDGYELLVPPQTAGGDVVTGSIQLGDNSVWVSTRNMAASMVTSGPMRRIDVGGSPGWAFIENPDTRNDITWQVDDHTYAYLTVEDGSSPQEALALAESVTFIPLDDWLTLYTPDLPTAPTQTTAPSG